MADSAFTARQGATGATGADGATGDTGPAGPAGGPISIPYVFSTTTTDSDPGNGNLRLNNATQDAATAIRADLLDANGSDWTAVIDAMDDSTSTVKGHIRIFKTDDPTKFLVFTVSAVDSSTGYRNITVANVASSAGSPFANSDQVTLTFERVGDEGSSGSTADIGCRVYNSGNISINNNTVTVLTFNSERWDTDSMHESVTHPSRITCNTAGKYMIAGNIQFAGHNDALDRWLAILLNGTTIIAIQKVSGLSNSDAVYISVATIYDLAQNDYVELECYQLSGVALNVVASANWSPEFMAQKIA